MTQLAGKVVWITGATSGIGEQLALQAAHAGAKLVLSARRETELQRVRMACPQPEHVAVLPLDLARLHDAEAAARSAEGFFGPVDILVNNAGISQRTLALETPLQAYRQLMEVDYFAPVALTQSLLPGMLGRGAGHVVVVSSVLGKVALARRTGYAAAKHALHGYYDSVRIELGDKGLRFTLACPGFVNTNVSVNALGSDGLPWGKKDKQIHAGMDPAHCARRIWRAVQNDELEVIIAGKERIAVLIKRFLPLRLYTAFARRLKVD
jgi:dehydrogenase/reductase SDR family member 7B